MSSVLQDISGKDQPLEGVCLSLLFVAAHRWSGSDDLSMNWRKALEFTITQRGSVLWGRSLWIIELSWWLSKESSCNTRGPGSFPGRKNPLEQGMVTHSSILTWKIPWMKEPSRLHSSWGHKESDRTDWLTTLTLIIYDYSNSSSEKQVKERVPAWGQNCYFSAAVNKLSSASVHLVDLASLERVGSKFPI